MIRRATKDDAKAIHELLVECFVEFKPQYTPACFDATVLDEERVVRRLDEGPIWVAYDGDKLLATLGAKQDTRGLYVRGMGVHPIARGRGLGNELLDCAKDYAVAHGISLLWLSTTKFLFASQKLYRNYGFEPAPGPNDLHGTELVSFAMNIH